MTDRLNIANEMRQLDSKNRDFYDELTAEEKKKFSTYLMIRWGSTVDGSRELQEYYVQSTNHYLNRHYFALHKHPKLQWLMATAVSPGMGNLKHSWLSYKKAPGSDQKKKLRALFPDLKDDDLDLLDSITDNAQLQQYVKDLGHDDK